MKNLRRYKRYTLDIMEVNGSMIRATDMTIIDIALGGISVKAGRRLNIGSEYTLKLTDKSKVLLLRGVVVWCSLIECRQAESGERIPIYQAGMEFTNTEEGEMYELLSFIERNRVHEFAAPKGKSINVRVHITAQDKAILYSHEKYKVRQISLGGMRIDSAYRTEIDSTILVEIFPPGNSTINFIGRVASVNQNSHDSYSVGIEFLDMTEGDRKALADLIDSSEALDDEDSSEKKTLKSSMDEQVDVIPEEVQEKVEYLYAWHKSMGYFKVLGVKDYASDREIKNAYLQMVKEFHPDKYFNCSSDMKEKLHVISTYLNTAYSTLIDPEKRQKYEMAHPYRVRG